VLCKCNTKYLIRKWKIYCLLFFKLLLKIIFSEHLAPSMTFTHTSPPLIGTTSLGGTEPHQWLLVYKMGNVSKSIIWKMTGCLVFLHRIRYVLSIYFPVNCILWYGTVLYWGSSHIQVNVVPYVCSRPFSLLSNSILNAIHLQCVILMHSSPTFF